jgi:hypothetical protein
MVNRVEYWHTADGKRFSIEITNEAVVLPYHVFVEFMHIYGFQLDSSDPY